MKPHLFTPLKIRDLEIKNRIFVSPMCQYSAIEGVPQAWHLVHLGSRAVGGAGLVMAEATSVSAVGRISSGDTGIWNEEQTKAFLQISQFIKGQNCIAAIQIAHAGRKASSSVPWAGDTSLDKSNGGWETLAPSAKRFSEHYAIPKEMTKDEITFSIEDFVHAAKNSLKAGFQVLELHMAHGYLAHEFLSPLSNFRTDEYGGSLENRMRFPLELAKKVRRVWPEHLPLFVRISASDWVEGGWDLPQSIEFCKRLKEIGVDFIDCSSGGSTPNAVIKVGPGYQVPFSECIRSEVKMMTGAVGVIVEAHQAEKIIAEGQADAVLMAREFLRDPYFPLHAAKSLDAEIKWPVQYERAKR